MDKKDYNNIEVKKTERVEAEVIADVDVEKKEVQKLVSVTPKKAKKGLFSRLVTGVVGPDGLPGIGQYVNDEIVVPAVKNILFDAITSGISMVLYGDKGGRPTRGGGRPYNSYYSGSSRTTYNTASSRYSPSNRREEPIDNRVRPSRYDVDEYVIEDRFEASNVLVSLTEYADRYDRVSVADYYEMINVESNYTDNNYGWTIDSISRASVMPVRNGYIIKFPPVEVL